MIPLYRPEQVQEMDRRAFARGVDPAALMDLAAGHLAHGVLRLAAARGRRRHGLRVVLLCGKGNNGGDGVAAARHLGRRGVDAVAVLVTPEGDLGPDPAREVAALRRSGGRVLAPAEGADDAAVADLVAEAVSRADVGVDCLLGTGASGEPRGAYARGVEALLALRQRGGLVVACDLPTGVDATTGRVPGQAVHADLTVTLGAHKQGLWLHPAASLAGELVLGEIGVDDGNDAPIAGVLQREDLPRLVPPAGPRSHKRSRGVVVIYAGSPAMAGAGLLAARAALHAGAGLVTLATPASVAYALTGQVPEVMLRPLPRDPDGIVAAVTEACEQADVLAIGPGLGLAETTQQSVRRLVADPPADLVLDADGINAFRDHVEELAARSTERALVLTPHAREHGRLAGTSGHGVHARRTELARETAERFTATVVAKGPRSVVAAPDGRTWVTPTGGPGLATGGTGDVLTGVTATLHAQAPAPDSVAVATWLHGHAGDLAAAAVGVRGTSAGVVVDHLGPAALDLGL